MLQELIATTTLGPLVGIGEFFDEAHKAKAGKYNVYKVFQQKDGEYAILFVHEAENQDVNTLLPQLDAQESFGVDGGSYGILTMKDESDTWSGNDRYEEWYEYSENASKEMTDGYVTWTNYGDGDFVLFSNDENSVFLLDDEDVYLSELLADCENFNMDDLEYYSFGSKIEVDYAVPQADGVELVEKQVKLPKGERRIDAIADLIRTILSEG